MAQGSALGPDLWNAMYDGVLKIELPEWAKLIGYADDIAAIIRAREPAQAQWRAAWVCRRVKLWLDNHGLQLAASKTEVVVLTGKRGFPKALKFQIAGVVVPVGDTVKYLGEKVDREVTHWPHISDAADKAAKMTAALSRLMPNTNGPKANKRRILMSVTHSIMLYGSEVWAEALNAEKYRKKMASVQWWGAMRMASAYEQFRRRQCW